MKNTSRKLGLDELYEKEYPEFEQGKKTITPYANYPDGYHVGYATTLDNPETQKQAVKALLHGNEVTYQTHRVCIPPSALAMHAYLVGATGFGKSELLKTIVHANIAEPKAAMVILDPAGDFAEQIAQLKEFALNNRLLYVKPTLKQGYTPTINPFELSGVLPEDTSEYAISTKQVAAQQVLEAFELMIAGGMGSSISLPMRALLMPCILTLMDRPGSTLLDLQRFMLDQQNGDLIHFGTTRKHYPSVAPFFEQQFSDPRFKITKGSIATKLQELFNSGFFVNLTCGRTTVDLEDAIKRKKIVVFNLAKQDIGAAESQSFGRLIVSLVLSIAMRRATRVPCYLMIDECASLMTPSIRTILLEARKFKLHLLLAQQMVGENMPPAMRDVITGSCNVQITGYQHRLHQGDAANLLGVDPASVGSLDKGDFLMAMGNRPAIKFHGRTDLLGNSHSMSPQAWRKVVEYQTKTYYRPITQPKSPPEPSGYDADVV